MSSHLITMDSGKRGAEPPLVDGSQTRHITFTESQRPTSSKANAPRMLFNTKFVLAQSHQRRLSQIRKKEMLAKIGNKGSTSLIQRRLYTDDDDEEDDDDEYDATDDDDYDGDDDNEDDDDGDFADEDSSDGAQFDREPAKHVANDSMSSSPSGELPSEKSKKCIRPLAVGLIKPSTCEPAVKSLRKPLYAPQPSVARSYTGSGSAFRPSFASNPRLTYSLERSSAASGRVVSPAKRPLSIASKRSLACKDQIKTELRVFPFWGELRKSKTEPVSFLPSLEVIQREGYVICFEEQRKINPVKVQYKEYYRTLRHHFKEIQI